MHAGQRRRGEEFHREVPVGYGIQRVSRRPVEAERGRSRIAVDRERGAGQRRGAERAFIEAPPAIGETAAVAANHFDIRHQVMAERHRLGDLQVGEARHNRRRVGFRLIEQRRLQRGHRRIDPVDCRAHP